MNNDTRDFVRADTLAKHMLRETECLFQDLFCWDYATNTEYRTCRGEPGEQEITLILHYKFTSEDFDDNGIIDRIADDWSSV